MASSVGSHYKEPYCSRPPLTAVDHFIAAVNREDDPVVRELWAQTMTTGRNGELTQLVPEYITGDDLKRITKGNSYINLLVTYFKDNGRSDLAEVLCPTAPPAPPAQDEEKAEPLEAALQREAMNQRAAASFPAPPPQAGKHPLFHDLLKTAAKQPTSASPAPGAAAPQPAGPTPSDVDPFLQSCDWTGPSNLLGASEPSET